MTAPSAELPPPNCRAGNDPPTAHVFFRCHWRFPESYVEGSGRSLPAATSRSLDRLVMAERSVSSAITIRHTLRLSKPGRSGEWLKPIPTSPCPALVARRVKELVVFPISFVHERPHRNPSRKIDIEYGDATESWNQNSPRVPALRYLTHCITRPADFGRNRPRWTGGQPRSELPAPHQVKALPPRRSEVWGLEQHAPVWKWGWRYAWPSRAFLC